MVQAYNGNQNSYGSINKIGTTNEGRVVYQVTDQSGQNAGKISIAPQHSDIFERSYNDMMSSAPQIMAYQEKFANPDYINKQKKKASWTLGICSAIGGAIPMLTVKCDGWKGWAKAIGLTAIGTIAGFFAGTFAVRATTPKPPEAINKFEQAVQTISQLDVQPIKE